MCISGTGTAQVSDSTLASVLFVLLLLVGCAQLLGYLFVKLRQPKVVGEIAAGILLGPALLGRLPFLSHLIDNAKHQGNILDFVYWLGLLLLMFSFRGGDSTVVHPRRAPRSQLAGYRGHRNTIRNAACGN
jgi:hypothetical protein